MVGLVKKSDGFFETRDAVLRAAKEPQRAGHIGVELAEHERSRVLADYIDAKLKILERFFAVALLVVAVRDLAIGFRHPEPIAAGAEMVERSEERRVGKE